MAELVAVLIGVLGTIAVTWLMAAGFRSVRDASSDGQTSVLILGMKVMVPLYFAVIAVAAAIGFIVIHHFDLATDGKKVALVILGCAIGAGCAVVPTQVKFSRLFQQAAAQDRHR